MGEPHSAGENTQQQQQQQQQQQHSQGQHSSPSVVGTETGTAPRPAMNGQSASEGFDLSSYDPLQAHAMQLTASAGLNNVSFYSAAPAPAPTDPPAGNTSEAGTAAQSHQGQHHSTSTVGATAATTTTTTTAAPAAQAPAYHAAPAPATGAAGTTNGPATSIQPQPLYYIPQHQQQLQTQQISYQPAAAAPAPGVSQHAQPQLQAYQGLYQPISQASGPTTTAATTTPVTVVQPQASLPNPYMSHGAPPAALQPAPAPLHPQQPQPQQPQQQPQQQAQLPQHEQRVQVSHSSSQPQPQLVLTPLQPNPAPGQTQPSTHYYLPPGTTLAPAPVGQAPGVTAGSVSYAPAPAVPQHSLHSAVPAPAPTALTSAVTNTGLVAGTKRPSPGDAAAGGPSQKKMLFSVPSLPGIGSASVSGTAVGTVPLHHQQPHHPHQHHIPQVASSAVGTIPAVPAPSPGGAPGTGFDDPLGDDTDPIHRKLPANYASMSAEDKRRYDRNIREQQRSFKISQQIKELRNVLAESNIAFKPNKFSILLNVVEYIKQLQSRAIMLDAEHRKLISTIKSTNEMVEAGHNPEEEAAAAAAATAKDKHGQSVGNDADMLFVQGLDYRGVFDQCSAALSVAALDGRILACNNEFATVSGFTRQQLLQQSVFNLMQNHQEVFKAMGDMLSSTDHQATAANASGNGGSGNVNAPAPMYWSGVVNQKDQNLFMNITLTRTADGLPKFFNCALTSAS